MKRVPLALCLALAVSACGTSSPQHDMLEAKYHRSTVVRVCQDGSLVVRDIDGSLMFRREATWERDGAQGNVAPGVTAEQVCVQ